MGDIKTTPRELHSQCVPPCFSFFPSGIWGCFCDGLFRECMYGCTCVYTDADTCGRQRKTSSLSSSVTVPLDSEIYLSLNLKLFQPGWQASPPDSAPQGYKHGCPCPAVKLSTTRIRRAPLVYFLTQTHTLDRDGCAILLKSRLLTGRDSTAELINTRITACRGHLGPQGMLPHRALWAVFCPPPREVSCLKY